MRKFLLVMTLALVPGFSLPATAKFPDLVVTDYGAQGDGKADDSQAFATVIQVASQQAASGYPGNIRIPAGHYLLKSKTLPVMSRGLTFVGDGPHQTYIILDPAYSGDVFSWSEAWMGSAYNGPTTLNSALDKAGPSVKGLTIIGDLSSTNRQNAFMFYDREDLVEVSDVDVLFVPGTCLGIGGITLHDQVDYVRESVFSNIHCWNTGLPGVPAVKIGSKTNAQTDATNQIKFYNLNVFGSADVGIAITAESQYATTRTIEFHGVRSEYSGGDDVQVGSATDAGRVAFINFYGLKVTSPGQSNAGHFGLNIDTAGLQSYAINVQGAAIGPCSGNIACLGVNIGNVREAYIQLVDISTNGANITYTGKAGAPITITGNTTGAGWTTSGSPPP